MKAYEKLSASGQVARLSRVAREVWQTYDLGDARSRLVDHGYNTTFRMDARDGKSYALRLNTSRRKSREALNAEVAWTTALADAGLPVPRPVQGRSVWAAFPGWDEGLAAVLYPWLPGRVAGKTPRPWMGAALARLTKALHAHAKLYTLPEGAEVKVVDGPLHEDECRIGAYPAMMETVAKAQTVWDLLKREPARLLHHDLHAYNLTAYRGRLSAFDFDDVCLGHPAQDAMVTTYYLRSMDPKIEEGYRRELPPEHLGVTEEEFEAVIAGRQVLLANDLFLQTNPVQSAMAERYAPVAEARLAAYLKTGKFDPKVAAFRR